ncbi:MAG: Gfo/Idh/MocA family oxidoreductase [Candidatus Binatia bacterium]
MSPGRITNWGILGTGKIARLFASELALLADAKLVAIGSRNKAKARAFGEEFCVPYRYSSYAELAGDPRVQAVYIATPASAHKENMLLCLNAGKAVLCEKPFTVNAREAEEVIALARAKNVFLMEAMWTRFLPLMVKVRELLAAGAIGEVSQFIADLGTASPIDPEGQVFSAELGGGALLQKGVYLLSLASMILGTPKAVKSCTILGDMGVDEHAAVLLKYAGPRMASLICSVRVQSQRQATLVGTAGRIKIHEPITCPARLTLYRYPTKQDWHRQPTKAKRYHQAVHSVIKYCKRSRVLRQLRERFPRLLDRLLHGVRSTKIYAPPSGEGLHYQVSEVMRCLRDGEIESGIMPLSESLSIMRTLDEIREHGTEETLLNC